MRYKRRTYFLLLCAQLSILVVGVYFIALFGVETARVSVSTEASIFASHSRQTSLASELLVRQVQSEVDKRPELFDAFDGEFADRWVEVIKTIPQVRSVNLINSDGVLINDAVIRGKRVIDLSDRDYVIKPSQGDKSLIITEPIYSRARDSWFFGIGRGIFSIDDFYLGTMLLGIEPNYFLDLFSNTDGLGLNMVLLSGEDRVSAARFLEGSEAPLGEVLESLPDHNILQFNDLPYLGAGLMVVVPVEGWPFKVMVHMPLKSIVLEILTPIAVFLGFFMIATFLNFYLFRKLQKSEDTLVIAREKAEHANSAKSEFLASISHELRTPMTTVLGYSDLMLDKGQSPENKEGLTRIKSATSSLLQIVNDVLDISKLEAGKLEIENLDFNLRDLLKKTIEIFEHHRTENDDVVWTLVCNADVPLNINTDPTRLRQVLVNLLGNARKFTRHGEIKLKCAVHGRGTENQFLEFIVQDTGIGMSAETLAKIFNEFVQADHSISRKYQGSGLGLSICKKLVELMNGYIHVASEEGVGSTFRFTIAYQDAIHDEPVLEKSQKAADYVAKRPLHILLAEDNRVNQKLIEKVLSNYGHKVSLAENGLQVIEKMAGEQIFDLILMDVRMPEMDGIEATRAIRIGEGTKASIPIIAATADVIKTNVDEYIYAGMNACVTKPFNWVEVLNTINEVMGEEIHVLKN